MAYYQRVTSVMVFNELTFDIEANIRAAWAIVYDVIEALKVG